MLQGPSLLPHGFKPQKLSRLRLISWFDSPYLLG